MADIGTAFLRKHTSGLPPADTERINQFATEANESVRRSRSAQEVTGNLGGLRQQESQRHGGAITALPTAEEEQEDPTTPFDLLQARFPDTKLDPRPAFREDSGLKNLEGEDVGPSFSGKMAFAKGSNREALLNKTFGEKGWGMVDNKVYINMPDGTRSLADSFGFDESDLWDLADEGAELAGGIAGVAAAPATAGAFVLSLFGAIGAQFAATVPEVMMAYGVDNTRSIGEIFTRRGTNAAVETAFGMIPGGLVGARVRSTTEGSKIGISEPLNRLKKLTDVDVPVSLGERTGSSSIRRFENIGEKVIGSAQQWEELHRKTELALQNAQKKIIGDGDFASKDAVDIINDQAAKSMDEVKKAEFALDTSVQRRLEEVGDAIGPGGRVLKPTDAGSAMRNAAVRERRIFRTTNDMLYGRYRDLAGDVQVIPAQRFQGLADRLRTALPQDAEGGPSASFLPSNARRFLNGLRTIDDMTIDQARTGRRVINDLIDQSATTPGANTQVLMDIHREMTDAINDGVNVLRGQNPAAADALAEANRHYGDNVDQFLAPGVREAYSPLGEKGYKEASEIFTSLMNGPPERLSRAFQVMDIDERRAFSRTAWNDMLAQSKPALAPSGVNIINPEKLSAVISQYERADKDVLYSLFDPNGTGSGEKMVNSVKEVLNAAAIRGKKLDFGDGLDLSGDLKKQVGDALQREKNFANEFQTEVLGPFVRNEIGVSQFKPELFSRHITSLKPDEIDGVIQRFALEGKQEELSQIVVKDMFERSFKQASGADAIEGVITPGTKILDGSLLSGAIAAVGDDTLTKLIGKDALQGMKDIATIRIGASDKTSASSGGLIAGAINAAVIVGEWATSLPFIGKLALFSRLATSQKVGKFAAGVKRLGTAKKGEAPKSMSAAVLFGQVAEDVLKDLKDDPDAEAMMRQFFNAQGVNPKGDYQQMQQRTSKFLQGATNGN